MAAPYPQIVLFGDSLFRHAADTLDGFSLQAALQWHTQRRFDVINRGLSGYNTSQALRVLPTLFPPPSPSPFTPRLAYLFVLFGANDSVLPDEASGSSQHVPLATYTANLTAILTHPNIQAHRPTVVLVTPPPLDGFRRAQFERDNPGANRRKARVTAEYAAAARKVAETVPGVVLADLWGVLMGVSTGGTPTNIDTGTTRILGDNDDPHSQAGHLSALLCDGLHLTGKGYRMLWESLITPLIVLPDNAESTEGFVTPGYETAPWMEETEENK
ncbi:hypothetical protein SEUCBS139899_009567 [Sporothrix eucalyptigena]|uniref:SGNH hydrolase-type esterase domain-containing protein n=1 Tax=Sporothrix eucalyptigena TaxID=1812306 RepID=A0ABP0C5N3_9PEZI